MPENQTPFQIDAALRRLARDQLGLLTVRQASEVGVDRWALGRRRVAGFLVPVFPGVVRLASTPATPEQRVLAAALAVPGSTIAGTSAGVAHRMPVGGGIGTPMVATGAARCARTPGMVTIRQQVALPSQPWHGVRLATPAATLVLLPRFVDQAVVERCLDHCLAHRLMTVAKVRALIDDLPPRAVVGRRSLLGLLDERTAGIGHRSGLEQRVARWLDDGGLGGWRPNFAVPVAGGRTVEVDFAWPDAAVALEVSPFFTHGSQVAQERDAERRGLLTAQRWFTVEATDADLVSSQAFERCRATLRALLAPATSRAPRSARSPAARETSADRKAG